MLEQQLWLMNMQESIETLHACIHTLLAVCVPLAVCVCIARALLRVK